MGFWKAKRKRVVVIGLDGVPWSFVRRMAETGDLGHFRRLLAEGTMTRMRSTIPCVSSVAWSSYMTGRNPGKHGIFGFVDRHPASMELHIPTARDMRCSTLWKRLSELGKRVLVINVPLTYPPQPVNGILIGCFLCTNIDKVAYPSEVSRFLKEKGYRIDVDASQAGQDRKAFFEALHETLRKRVEIGLSLYEREEWDFFQLHIMETDRINHFFWDAFEDEGAPDREAFFLFYREVDRAIGEIEKRLDSSSELVLLSDHGFCKVRKEINLNVWLKEKGWLKLQGSGAGSLKNIHSDSLAYSLIPGRVYVNLKGRELRGRVMEGKELREVTHTIQASLREASLPESGEHVIKEVFLREEIYQGPFREKGPDLVAIPFPGFDLKGGFESRDFAVASDLRGMHTDEDAFLYVRGHRLEEKEVRIVDVYPTILTLMDVPPDSGIDGTSLIKG